MSFWKLLRFYFNREIQGLPHDPKRLDLFQKLYESLGLMSTQERIMRRSGSALPFFEAYFSNFTEGTEFQVEKSQKIVLKTLMTSLEPTKSPQMIKR